MALSSGISSLTCTKKIGKQMHCCGALQFYETTSTYASAECLELIEFLCPDDP